MTGYSLRHCKSVLFSLDQGVKRGDLLSFGNKS